MRNRAYRRAQSERAKAHMRRIIRQWHDAGELAANPRYVGIWASSWPVCSGICCCNQARRFSGPTRQERQTSVPRTWADEVEAWDVERAEQLERYDYGE